MTRDEEYISIKFRWISFALAVMIMLLHAGSLRGVAEVPIAAKNFHVALGYLIWSPVPIFFIISGYFFGMSNYVRDGGYYNFMSKKCRTLLTPYVIFALLGTFMAMPLMFALNHIKNLPWYDRTVFAGEHWWQWCDAILGISTAGPLNNGPLWYVHSLFCVFMFAPIWRFLFRRLTCWVFLLPLILCQIFVSNPFDTVVPILNVRLLVVWFFAGMFLAGVSPILLHKRRPLVVALSGLLVLLCLLHIPYLGWLRFWLPLFQLAFIWTSFDLYFSAEAMPALPEFVGLSFWMYCIHAIVSNLVVPIGHYFLGEGAIALCCLTILNFALCLLITIGGGLWLKRRNLRLYEVLSGGRG